MNTITLIIYVTAVLTVILLVLTAVIVLLNIVTDQRIAFAVYLRSKMLPVLQQYLAGTAHAEAVLSELQRDREIALECLVEAASGLPSDKRPQLHVFFEYFQFKEELLDELLSRNWAKCIRAATRLGYTGSQECVPVLLKALRDDMLDVRIAAARALAQLGASEAVGPILRALALPGALPQQITAEILYEMGRPAIEPLLGFLRDGNNKDDGPALAVAVRVLGLLKADNAAPEIVALLKHLDSEVRLNSARTLGLLGANIAAGPLCQLVRDPVWEVRSSAVQSLGHIKDATAIPFIATALGDQAWWVRFNAAQALFELGGAGIAALKSAMAVNPDAFARDISRQIMEEHNLIAA